MAAPAATEEGSPKKDADLANPPVKKGKNY
jgi:hypothetical protein